MADPFEHRLRLAVRAGWLTFLIALAIFLIQWIMYLVFLPVQPDWLLRMWGPGASWPEVRTVWFWFMAFFKLLLILAAFVLIWLGLWARFLRKRQTAAKTANSGGGRIPE